MRRTRPYPCLCRHRHTYSSHDMKNGHHTALPLSEFSGPSLSHERFPTRHHRRRHRRQVVSHKHRNRALYSRDGVSYLHRSPRNRRHKFALRFHFLILICYSHACYGLLHALVHSRFVSHVVWLAHVAHLTNFTYSYTLYQVRRNDYIVITYSTVIHADG